MTYEEKIKKLDEIIKKMEEGNVGLEENIKLFDEASEIIKSCYFTLKEGKGKVVEITENLKEIDFDIDK